MKKQAHCTALNLFLQKYQVGKRPILISGHGRSGTTWVGSVVSAARRVLYYFEPCHPYHTGQEDFSVWFKYQRPGQRDVYLESIFDPVFQGTVASSRRWDRADWHRLIPGYRVVVKDVATFLALGWLSERYQPHVLVVIRHPCPVILSELRQGTSAAQSHKTLLAQQDLIEDHLGPYCNLLRSASTPYEVLGAIWGARHRVLVNLMIEHPAWHVVLYEDLCARPVETFQQLFADLHLSWTAAMQEYIVASSTTQTPGMYTTKRVSAVQPVRWKYQMDQSQVEAVRRYVESFELPFYASSNDWELGGELE